MRAVGIRAVIACVKSVTDAFLVLQVDPPPATHGQAPVPALCPPAGIRATTGGRLYCHPPLLVGVFQLAAWNAGRLAGLQPLVRGAV